MIAPVEVQDDWRKSLVEFLNDPNKRVNYHLRKRVLGYCLLNGQLDKRTAEKVLLRCLGLDEA